MSQSTRETNHSVILTSFSLTISLLLMSCCLLLSSSSSIASSPSERSQHQHSTSQQHSYQHSQYHPADYHPPIHEFQDESLPWCSPSNLQLRNASAGEFFLLPDGTFRYEFPHCKLRRFTPSMVSHCLKGTHLVFMGDSLSRYLYLSLSYLLANHHWGRKFCRVFHEDYPISVLNEKDYKSWNLFYHDSNAALNHGNRAIEICDCYRNDAYPFVTADGINQQASTCEENRHFRYLPTGNADDDEHDVRLSYIQWYGLMPMRGHLQISSNIPRNSSIHNFLQQINKLTCGPQNETMWPLSYNCTSKWPDRGLYDFPHFAIEICSNYSRLNDPTDLCQKFERTVLGPMGTTHLIMNIGWHNGLMHVAPHFLEKVVSAAETYWSYPGPEKTRFDPGLHRNAKHSSKWGNIHLPRVTWRTSTFDAIFNSGDSTAKEFSEANGTSKLEYFDVYKMTKQLRMIQNAIEKKDWTRVTKLVKLSKWWPKDKPIQEIIQHPWTDNAHTEPWVYTEIHEVFLNSICPLRAIDSP